MSGTPSGCKFLSLLYYSSCTASFITLGTVAVDRYRVIHQRNKANNKVLKHTYIVIAVTWIVALICSAPAPNFTTVLAHDSMSQNQRGHQTCVLFFAYDQVRTLLVTFKLLICVVWGAVPVIMMTWFYAFFYRTLRKVSYKRRSRTLMFICILLMSFLILQTPFLVVTSFDAYALLHWDLTCDNINHREAIVTLGRIVPNFHCMINPMLYAFLGNDFITKFKQCLSGELFSKRAFLRAKQNGTSAKGGDTDCTKTNTGGSRPVSQPHSL